MPVPHNAEYEPSVANCSKKSRCKSGTSTQVSSTALNIAAVCQSPTWLHRLAGAAGILQQLRNFLRVFDRALELLRGIGDELSTAGVQAVAIVQHFSQAKFPAGLTWDGRCQFTVFNELHNCWSAKA